MAARSRRSRSESKKTQLPASDCGGRLAPEGRSTQAVDPRSTVRQSLYCQTSGPTRVLVEHPEPSRDDHIAPLINSPKAGRSRPWLPSAKAESAGGDSSEPTVRVLNGLGKSAWRCELRNARTAVHCAQPDRTQTSIGT